MESVGIQLDYSIGCLGRALLLFVQTGPMESVLQVPNLTTALGV